MDIFFILDTPIVAYWDGGNCGPIGDDANWEWCDRNGRGPCQQQVSTSQCASGTASLQEVHGNPENPSCCSAYHLNGCGFAYYAVYT